MQPFFYKKYLFFLFPKKTTKYAICLTIYSIITTEINMERGIQMIFETHAHYDDDAFDIDRDELLAHMQENGIETVVNIAASLKSVQTTMDLTKQYAHVYGAVGVHPSETEELNEENFAWMKEMAKDEKCLAIGEIGLDYHYPDPERDVQKTWFIRQMELAKEINKPVIIHSREAAADTMEILSNSDFKDVTGVMHCYSYSVEIARELMKMDYYFGIGGVVTFSNAKKLVQAVNEIPMDRILLETDCPYLAPTPHRGERNSSLYLPLVVNKIAEIKGISYDEVVQITCDNAKRFFKL